jgi:hypothetical protein
MSRQEVTASVLTWGFVLGVLACGLVVGCASTNDGLGDAALVAGGAAAGATVGGTLWAAVAAGFVSLWNAFSGGDSQAAINTLTLGERIGVLMDKALLWGAIALVVWFVFPRTRGALKDAVLGSYGFLKNIATGQGAEAKEAGTAAVLAVPRLAGLVGEPLERRAIREAERRVKTVERKANRKARR